MRLSPAHVSMADAVRLFRERGFDLIVADATVDSVRGDAQIASAIANPAISGGVGRSFGFNSATCPGCSALAWDVGVSDQSAVFDTLSGKRGLRSRTAELALSVARQNRADTQRTLESMLRQQYLEAVYSRDALGLAHESQSRLGHVMELNQARFQHGAISQVDALKVETEKLEADQEVERAEFDLAEAKFQLAFLLGVRGRVPDFEVDADLPRYRVPDDLGHATVDSLLERARQQRPRSGSRPPAARACRRGCAIGQAPALSRHRALARREWPRGRQRRQLTAHDLAGTHAHPARSSTISKVRCKRPRPMCACRTRC
jgi:cobalt-zinc-cadmium efflux system outer membrane protein